MTPGRTSMSMKSHSDSNERTKRHYIHHLRHKLGLGDVTVDQFSKAIHRFETYTKFTDFEDFHHEQVIGFKQHLQEQRGVRSGKPLSKPPSTRRSTLSRLSSYGSPHSRASNPGSDMAIGNISIRP